jgi:DNA invertase Pin-like site-specific DNA recombinase
MKVALYVRNSTDEERQNPETQLRPLKEKCEKENWEYAVFQEFASGSKESRPELDKMMQRIRNKEFDIVLVWKLDRLGRSLKHILQLIEEFKNKSISFISLTEGFDTSTPQGKLFIQVSGAFAEFERNLIQERINAGLKRRVSEGKPLGRQKGAVDKRKRNKTGYYLRWKREKKSKWHTPINKEENNNKNEVIN